MSEAIHVWPGLDANGVSVTVYAEDGVTPIPAAGGAIVPVAPYYQELVASGMLLDHNPTEMSGDPVTLVAAPVIVTDSPSPGEVIKYVGSGRAEWQTDAGGSGNTAINAPPNVSAASDIGADVGRYAREGHTHGLDAATASTQGALSASEFVLLRDRRPKEYVAQAGSWSLFCNGVNNDNNALHTLLNTTMQPNGGKLRFAAPTTVSAAGRTWPANVYYEFDPNSVFTCADTTNYVFLGPVWGPRLRLFSDEANGRILLPGKDIHAEWFGAKADGGVTDSGPRILEAIRSLAVFVAANPHASSGLIGGGGVLRFDDTTKYYGFKEPIEFFGTSSFPSKLWLKGPGKVRHVKDRTLISHATTPQFSLTANTTFGWIEDLRVTDMTFSGNGPEDYSQCLFVGGVRRGWFVNVRVENTAKEGFHSSNPSTSLDFYVAGCSTELNGKGDGSEVIAAYNFNANQLRLIGNSSYDVGMFIEQTGKDFVCLGNIFREATFRGIGMHSASWNSERAVVAANILAHAPSGILHADEPDSLGKSVSVGNVIYDCDVSISLGASGGHECISGANYLLGGDTSSEAYSLGPGSHVVQGDVISRVTGTTTGTIAAAGTTTGTITRGVTTGTTTADTETLVLGSATGVDVGYIVQIGTTVKKIVALAGTTATMDSKYDASIDAGVAVWSSPLVVASATGISVGSILTIAGVAGTKTVTAISGTSITLNTPASADATGAAVAHSSPYMTIPRGAGLSRGMYCTIAGVTGEKYIVDDLFTASDVRCWLDTPASAAVTGAVVTYESRKWGYIFRARADEYYTLKDNVIMGAAWNTSFMRFFRGMKARIGPNTFHNRGQAYPANIAVLSILDYDGNVHILLETDELEVTQPWAFGGEGRERQYFTAATWPTTRPITWYVGDVMHYASPTASSALGEIVTVAGTGGTLNGGATTANVTSGTRTATLNTVGGLYVGCKIAIAGVTGTKTVATVDPATDTITWPSTETTSDATVSGAVVSFVAPTRVKFGQTQAEAQADSDVATVADLQTNFNALLSKLRAAGVMST